MSKSFEEWLLDTYGIEDFDEYLKEYDYLGTLTEQFVKEWKELK